ncbi:SLATT domain-containing protein [Micromonospora sp. WMMD1102]|uniref:SLATT domain-containing protein n=1 Tax=Micromonospora sp. WMMD1102 TaxID=3016105 RepID=UPI002414FB5A|nr:SLATT domain-containing protein [Micromonospora sp. WMMD1102]MDG4788986.1 SLATT domain-containing protein [Micromonospora sp. WMMD1102]
MTTEPENPISGVKRAIRDEVWRLEESVMWSAQSQFEQAKRWRFVNLALGIPAAVLAALSGAAALSETTSPLVVGISALLAAGASTTATTLNAAQKTNQCSAAANAYLEVQTAARQLRLIDMHSLGGEDLRARLQEITSRRDEINKTAEVVSKFAYKRAAKNISSGGQSYEADGSGDS